MADPGAKGAITSLLRDVQNVTIIKHYSWNIIHSSINLPTEVTIPVAFLMFIIFTARNRVNVLLIKDIVVCPMLCTDRI